MKVNQRHPLLLASLVSFLIMPCLVFPGFEVGNGKKLIKNTPGNYEIIVPETLEVGFSNKFTEIIAPLFDGTPRAKLQINLVKNEKIGNLSELVNSVSPEDGSWTQTTLAGYDGIKSEIVLPTKLHQIEYRLFFKEFEILVLNIEGIPSYSPKSTFESLKKALETLKIKTK